MSIAGAAVLAAVVAIVAATTMSNGSPPQARGPVAPALRAAAVTTDPPITTSPTDVVASTDVTTTSTPTTTSAVGVPVDTATTLAGSVVGVAIVGDSISDMAKPDIERDLHRYNLYVDTVGGTTMVQHLANITKVAGVGQPRDWVIELGTNDAFQKNPNWASDFDNEVTALQAQRCVDFVTVNPSLGPISTGIDTAIANAVAAHPNFHVLDWGNTEFRKPGWLRSDRVHPSPSGSAELAKLIRKAIDGC